MHAQVKHERLGAKVGELMELERTFGAGGRETAYRDKVQALQLELSGVQQQLRTATSEHQLEIAQVMTPMTADGPTARTGAGYR